MLTTTAGSFKELGAHNDGRLNYGRATSCEGRRSNLRGDWATALFIWTAPPLNASGAPMQVTFRITTAASSRSPFRQNRATFSSNPFLPLPGAAASPPPPVGAPASPVSNYYPPPHAASVAVGGGRPINAKFKAHGWLMAIGWGVLIPTGVWAVRYGRPPVDSPPSKSALLESVRSKWFKLHWILNALGLGLATIGFFFSYAAVEDEGGDDAHLASDHSYYGAGALLLGLYQPLNAFLRPDNPLAGEKKSVVRGRWEWVHRLAGVAGLLMSVVAVTSGCEAAKEFGAVKGGDAAYKGYVAWLVIVVVATCVMEVVRWRERRWVAAAWAGSQSRNFVELSESIG